MFSSLSSFLPSALHLNNANTPENAPVIDVEEDEDEEQQKQRQGAATDDEGESGVKKKDKKEKSPHETFIFVRPPPAKSNHPLNLQVQLVPPNSKQRRQSLDSRVDASDTEGDPNVTVSLSRTPSMASEVSSYSASTSGYASTSSFASYSSTASGTGRRMIIPLYNLQAHNVMTNTIVDAGTDAKIAKFQKRGIEMIDLAVLEPVEVWVTPSGPAAAAATTAMSRGPGTSSRGSLDVGGGSGEQSLRNRLSFLGRPGTAHSPGSSALSLSSTGGDHYQHQHQEVPANNGNSNNNTLSVPTPASPPPPASPNPSVAPAAKKNIFGKLFDRKNKKGEIAAPGAVLGSG
ncbi:hypothetical protein V5O48_016047, partial [Marasmius crinis-equi]